jgi:copper(I)-binding protein
MRLFFWLLPLLGLALAQPSLQLQEGWVRRLPGNITAAYMVLVNPGPQAVRILAVSTPIATRVEFHQTTKAGGRDNLQDLSTMRRVEFLEVPARGRLEILPGRLHLMLYGLREKRRQPLREGEMVEFTLHLSGGGQIRLSLPAQMR